MPLAIDTVDIHGRPIVLPLIHMGGSPASRLLEQQTDVLTHLRAAYKAMTEAEPNGRDYVGNHKDVCALAIDQHILRLKALDRLIEEHEALQRHAAEHA